MVNLIVRAALIGFCLGGLMGCVSYAQYQDADVVKRGETKVAVGLGATQYSLDVDTTDSTGNADTETLEVLVPQISVVGRYGVYDKLELHTHIWLPLGGTVGAKYQLLGDSETPGLALSLGADVGYLTITSGDTESNILDTFIPVYLGYRIDKGMNFYVTPKYLLRTVSSNNESATSQNVGATFGVAFGSKTQLLLEASVIQDLTNDLTGLQGGIGVAF